MALLPMDIDILPPSDDRIFKLLLTSPEGKPALIDLISATIRRPVVDVTVRNNELPLIDTDEKAERLDVNCKIDDGSQVDLEMQASHIQEDSDGKHRNLKGKSIYYLCDLHSSQPSKGVRRYDRLAQTYQVTFCSYTVFPDLPDYANSFSMRHDTGNELLSDAIHVIYVELSKLGGIIRKSVDDMTDLEKWTLFL
jgi:predicted transposase/invertase (TIGR01784 family)